MGNDKKSFFNFSEEDEVQSSPYSNSSASESELIAFTDTIMTMIRTDELPYVIVQVYGLKTRKMNAQVIHGIFNWNPDPSNIDSFHLPTAAKSNIPELHSGTDYYALVRTPDNEKIGGVLISIKKDNSNSSDVWKSNNENMPAVIPKQSPTIFNSQSGMGDMEVMMAEQTQEMFQVVFKNYMNRFKSSLEKTMEGGDNEEIKAVKNELLTLRGVMEEGKKQKDEENKRMLLDEKDKELAELRQQIEIIHQKMNNPHGNTDQPQNQKEKGLSSILNVVKSIVEAKDVVFPILEGLGIQLPKAGVGGGGGGGNTAPVNMPNMPNQVQGGIYKESQNVQQTFKGFDEDDISFGGFDDNPSNLFENNNVSSNNEESGLEVNPMSYKKMADSIMVIILAKFKITDVVEEVIPLVEEEVSANFWKLVKDAGFDENYVLGIGLKNPECMASEILKHIPTELLNMIQNNPTGKNYTEVIKNLLIRVINGCAKKSLG